MTGKDKPYVSVLMPCYNAERWLADSIESIINQTFKNIEIILVDDGSTSDETMNIMRRYQDNDARIVIISKKHTGLTDSLNVGIGKAQGKWIARMDADDLCEPERLYEQVNFIHNHPRVILLGTGLFEIDEHSNIIKQHIYPSDHHRLVLHLERRKKFFAHSSAFYRTDVVRNIGGYNTRFQRSQDYRLWLTLSLHGQIACLNKPLVRIRKHANQISNSNNGRRQIYDGLIANICYNMIKLGHKDPSITMPEERWKEFRSWAEKRIEEYGVCDRQSIISRAREDFFSSRNKVMGSLRLGVKILQSNNPVLLISEKIFGTSISQLLAQEWIRRRCAE